MTSPSPALLSVKAGSIHQQRRLTLLSLPEPVVVGLESLRQLALCVQLCFIKEVTRWLPGQTPTLGANSKQAVFSVSVVHHVSFRNSNRPTKELGNRLQEKLVDFSPCDHGTVARKTGKLDPADEGVTVLEQQ